MRDVIHHMLLSSVRPLAARAELRPHTGPNRRGLGKPRDRGARHPIL